jgi:hypothetical protein
MIKPLEIPDDHAPLSDESVIDSGFVDRDGLIPEGKNVHVAFKDGSTMTGLLHSVSEGKFSVGNNLLRGRFSEVKYFREV